MKKSIFIAIIPLCMLLLGCEHNSSKDTIRVGAAIALTGYGSDFGQSENNAIALLKEKYGDDKVEFYIEDTQSDVKTGVTAIKKLIDINKCDIIYCELSAIVEATSNIVNNAEATLIAPVYLENLRDNPYAIRNLPSADQENSALLDYLNRNEIVHNRMAVLFSNDVFGQTCCNSFKRLLPDGCIICHEGIINESALRETALKAISTAPDVIYLGSMSETLGLLIKYLRQNGYEKEIITTDAFSYDYINSLAGEYANGVRYVDFTDNEKYEIFRNDYKERFGMKCVPSAMICYDGISAVISAKKNSKDLEGFSYNGLAGTIKIINQEIIYPIQVLTWGE